MSQKELRRNQYVARYIEGNIRFSELIEVLGFGDRQGRRIVKDFKRDGPASLMHGLRGKPSNHTTNAFLWGEVSRLIESHYRDIYPTLVHEKLSEIHGIHISDETVRKIMIRMGFWKPKTRKKPSPPFQLRLREDCYGNMIQFDGSYHEWIPGEKCCLLLAIDDATSQIVDAVFCSSEGIENVFPFWKEYFLLHGIPVKIYLDKYSTYRNNHPEAPDVPTQFGRVCTSLGTKLIFANSPQAKGRVERGNGTLQKRLIAEMILAQITTIHEANIFLKEVYIPKHNAKFAVLPKSQANMHRTMREEEKGKLDTIFSVHSTRKIQNDYTISFKTQLYQLHGGGPLIFRNEHVRVEERLDGTIVITQRERVIPHTKIEERPKKGYRKPLPPRNVESPKSSYFEETGKKHPWMQGFSYSKPSKESSLLILKERWKKEKEKQALKGSTSP